MARSEFSLTGELIFETHDIPGYEGSPIRIHKAAWAGISPTLPTVTVKPATHTSSPAAVARPRPPETLSSGSRRISAQKRMSMTGPPLTRLSATATANMLAPAARIVERQSLSARKSPFPTTSPQFPGAMPAYKEPGPSSYKSSPPSRQAPAATPDAAAIEELDDDHDDHDEEDVRLLSQKKKKNTRPRILSDYGFEEEAAEMMTVDEPLKADESASGDEDEFDQLDDADFTVSAGPSTRSQPRASKGSRTSGASIVELDGRPAGWADKAERTHFVRQLDGACCFACVCEYVCVCADGSAAPPPEPKVKVKAEKIEPKLERAPSGSQGRGRLLSHPSTSLADRAVSTRTDSFPAESQPGAAKSADESFLVMIEYAENPDSRSLFKTRARHTVSKVLMQACRTFELQAYYHSARLVLVAEQVDEETGEVEYRRKHTCGRHETMGEAGAEPDARFLVEIVEDEEDEEEDE